MLVPLRAGKPAERRVGCDIYTITSYYYSLLCKATLLTEAHQYLKEGGKTAITQPLQYKTEHTNDAHKTYHSQVHKASLPLI